MLYYRHHLELFRDGYISLENSWLERKTSENNCSEFYLFENIFCLKSICLETRIRLEIKTENIILEIYLI